MLAFDEIAEEEDELENQLDLFDQRMGSYEASAMRNNNQSVQIKSTKVNNFMQIKEESDADFEEEEEE